MASTDVPDFVIVASLVKQSLLLQYLFQKRGRFEEQRELVGAQPLLMWSYPQDPMWDPTGQTHVSSGSSWLWQVLRLPVFVVTLTVLRSTGQVFCQVSLSWDLCPVFLGLGVG